MGRVRSYEGEGIVVHFEPKLCIHAERCVHGLPAVFDAKRKPWIDPKGTGADAIAETIHRCPTGALTYERTDGGAQETPDAEASVRTVPDGPLHLRGRVEVVDGEGGVIEVGPRAALCRCGASKNKPYCDNSHLEIDFRTGS